MSSARIHLFELMGRVISFSASTAIAPYFFQLFELIEKAQHESKEWSKSDAETRQQQRSKGKLYLKMKKTLTVTLNHLFKKADQHLLDIAPRFFEVFLFHDFFIFHSKFEVVGNSTSFCRS